MPLVNYLDKQFDSYMTIESKVNREERVTSNVDPRVHCCLYFLPPHSPHRLRLIDVEVMRALGSKVNLVPVIAKADTLTEEELADFKTMVKDQLAHHEIKLYSIPDLPDDDESQADNKKHKTLAPFAVCGSLQAREGDGSRIRDYPFGTVNIEDETHCDFVALRAVLIRHHMQDFVDQTAETHYEKYRSWKLSSAAGASLDHSSSSGVKSSSGTRTAALKNPMAILEEERKVHEEKIKKMEADMQQVFEQKVQERERKLRMKEDEMMKKHEDMTRNLELQASALRSAKDQHMKNVQAWTDAQTTLAAAAAAAESAEQANSKDKKKKIFGR